MDTLIKQKQQIWKSIGAKIFLIYTFIMISVHAWDKVCFDACVLTKDVSIWDVECACSLEAQNLTIELTKTQRCFTEWRQNCALDMFKSDFGSSHGGAAPSDCFAACSCICNKGWTDSCATSPIHGACIQSCGCPQDEAKANQLLLKSQAYYNLPLNPKTDADLNAEFQAKLSDMITSKYKQAEDKVKFELNTQLGKIERKWNEYVANANRIGVDPVVFWNQTCSHDCFANSLNSTYNILTGCLINQCRCFYPSLPRTNFAVSFEALIALKEMITEEEVENKEFIPSQKVTLNSKLGSVIMQQEITPETPLPEVPLPTIPQVTVPVVDTTPTSPQPRTDILAEPIGTVKEWNLTCFRECLDLKKYVPFPVIQQCISLRCSCNLDTSVEKLDSLIQMSLESHVAVSNNKHSVIADFLFVLLVVAFIYSAYLYYKYLLENNKEFQSSSKGKEKYRKTGYEQLIEEPFYQKF